MRGLSNAMMAMMMMTMAAMVVVEKDRLARNSSVILGCSGISSVTDSPQLGFYLHPRGLRMKWAGVAGDQYQCSTWTSRQHEHAGEPTDALRSSLMIRPWAHTER